MQKGLVLKEATAIYIRSPAYFEFVLNIQGEAARVVKLAADLERKIKKLGPAISSAAVAAAEKRAAAAAGVGKKAKSLGKKLKGHKGKESATEQQGPESIEEEEEDEASEPEEDGDESEGERELQKLGALYFKLKTQKVRLALMYK